MFDPRLKKPFGIKAVFLLAMTFFLFAVTGSSPQAAPDRYASLEPFEPRFSPVKPLLSKGMILVAGRNLRDPIFTGTVVLLLNYGREGAIGLIINRPAKLKLSAAFPDIKGFKELPDTIYFGGPVSKDHLLMLLRAKEGPPGSINIFDDVYATASRGPLEDMAKDGKPFGEFRVFAGYAGWKHHQLESEVSRGDWQVLDAAGEFVFDKKPNELWHRLMR